MRPFESTLRECSVFFIVLFSFLPYFLYIFYQKFWEKSKGRHHKVSPSFFLTAWGGQYNPHFPPIKDKIDLPFVVGHIDLGNLSKPWVIVIT